jgi:phosphoglycolate phosphatase-like HAD superfamily hydrolase
MTNNLLQIQLEVLYHLDLEQYIHKVFTSNEYQKEKPDSTSLQHILQSHYKHIPKHKVIMIGDSTSDILWGEQEGVKSILCDRKAGHKLPMLENIKDKKG